MSDDAAINREHVPARCFFPLGKRENLIIVGSCYSHNNLTSKDDEYVRGIVVTNFGNNNIAYNHWQNAVFDSFVHSPKLFLKTFENRENDHFFHDTKRIDAVMTKTAYGLYSISSVQDGS